MQTRHCCVIITSSSAMKAKTFAKKLVRYNHNVGMLRNDRRESEMPESVSSKSQSSIENNIRIFDESFNKFFQLTL